MYKISFVIFFLICGIIVCQEETCRTSRNEDGICLSISNCKPFVDILKSESRSQENINYIRESSCSGFDGNYPLVCCPVLLPVSTTSPSSNSLPSVTATSSISEPTLATTTSPVSLVRTNTVRYTLPVTGCGISGVNSSMRVVGGVPAKLGEFPWMAILGYRNDKNPNQPKWLCGGTLVTDKHVLTAAHCIYRRPDLYMVRVGDLDLYSDDDGATPIDIRISAAKYHEQFSLNTFTNDIGLLTLSQRVRGQNVHPVCLPLAEPYLSRDYVNEHLYIAGWGSIYFNGPASPILQVVMLPVVSNQQCSTAYRNLAVIDERTICAGYTNGIRDACKGDSGGPMMYETNDLVTYQIGVISYGIGCAQPGIPAVYTRVSQYLDWIENNLN